MYLGSDDLGSHKLGLLVDREIVLSTRYSKSRVVINKTVSTETSYQQDLIVGKLGQGMRCWKCNSTSNVLVCESERKVHVWTRQ
jgi:hypothetical protein